MALLAKCQQLYHKWKFIKKKNLIDFENRVQTVPLSFYVLLSMIPEWRSDETLINYIQFKLYHCDQLLGLVIMIKLRCMYFCGLFYRLSVKEGSRDGEKISNKKKKERKTKQNHLM